MAFKEHDTGYDKCQSQINFKDNLLHTQVLKGRSNFTLENFISLHQKSYVSIEKYSEHVTIQLPNNHICVMYLLDFTLCNYAFF